MPRPDMRWLTTPLVAVITEADTQAVAVDRYTTAILAAGMAGAATATVTDITTATATVDAPATAFPLSAV
jgi:hypothetical protein